MSRSGRRIVIGMRGTLIRQLRPPLVLVAAFAVASGCATSLDPGSFSVDGLERWGCGDYFDGCTSRCPVTLTADLQAGTGTVTFTGIEERTDFRVHGLDRRWNWCLDPADNQYWCSFIISAEGRGRYFDFSHAMAASDGVIRAKPSDLFKCSRRRVRDADG